MSDANGHALPEWMDTLSGPALLVASDGRVIARSDVPGAEDVAFAPGPDGRPTTPDGRWSWQITPALPAFGGAHLAIASPRAGAEDRLMATLSHELRTPLNGIIGTASLLADTALDQAQTNYVGLVRQSAAQLLDLLNNVLDFSRLSEGALTLHPTSTDPALLAQDVCELLAVRAHARGIDLAVCPLPGLPARVEVDGTRLRQILFNLVGNAVKFTEAGGVVVTLAPAQAMADTGGEHIAISVIDTGPGFDPERAPGLFEAFAQARASDAARDSGVGLGLAIVSRLVAAMGGTITADAQPGVGASFRLVLPARTIAPAPPARLSPARLSGAALTVELVGFSPALQLSLGAFLSEAGVRVHVGPPPIRRPAGVIILADATLPQAQIAELASTAPVVVVLRPEDRALIPAFRALGCAGYLVKPVRPASLLERIGLLQAPEADEAASGGCPQRQNQRVLVADDNPVNALIARRALEKSGFDVTVVTTGNEAVEAALHAAFDLVLMDLRMPIMDGFAAMAGIRAAGLTDLPLIAISAELDPDTEKRALAAGANAVAAKPLDAETLRRIAVRWTQGDHAGAAA